MRGVLVTHADTPLGSRVALTLAGHSEARQLLLVGSRTMPRRLECGLGEAARRTTWVRARLSRHHSAAELFRSDSFRRAEIEAVVHVPAHGAGVGTPGPAGVPARTTEARLVLQHCGDTPSVQRLVAVGSAYVYRLLPGNANRLSEDRELDLDPDVPGVVRSWIDCDLLFREEAKRSRLRIALLRVPTVICADGGLHLNPALESGGLRARPAGFDPLCAVVAEGDVAEAVLSALRTRARGAFNVAGSDCVPLSTLERWTGRTALPVPGPLLGAARGALGWALPGVETLDGTHLRYGFSLDTRRAETELDFRPRYRIGLSARGGGVLRLEEADVGRGAPGFPGARLDP